MSKVYLENPFLKVEIQTKGAELSSLFDKRTETEHLWQADPKVWARHAPVLFPIVGQLEHNTFQAEGNEFNLSQHGFARDMEFELVMQTFTTAILVLKHSEATLQKYPYVFELEIEYILNVDLVEVYYSVRNTDTKRMWFSIGAHPGFVCPFHSGESFSDYILEFEEPETSGRLLFENGLLTGQKAECLEYSKSISLDHRLFDNDALILDGLKSTYVDLKHKDKPELLRFYFQGFPLLAFWTKPKTGADFLCIEPWFGVSDVRGAGGALKDKPYIQSLDAGEIFHCHYAIQLLVENV